MIKLRAKWRIYIIQQWWFIFTPGTSSLILYQIFRSVVYCALSITVMLSSFVRLLKLKEKTNILSISIDLRDDGKEQFLPLRRPVLLSSSWLKEVNYASSTHLSWVLSDRSSYFRAFKPLNLISEKELLRRSRHSREEREERFILSRLQWESFMFFNF